MVYRATRLRFLASSGPPPRADELIESDDRRSNIDLQQRRRPACARRTLVQVEVDRTGEICLSRFLAVTPTLRYAGCGASCIIAVRSRTLQSGPEQGRWKRGGSGGHWRLTGKAYLWNERKQGRAKGAGPETAVDVLPAGGSDTVYKAVVRLSTFPIRIFHPPGILSAFFPTCWPLM